MTPEAVIMSCARRGVTLWRDGDKLRYRAKRGAMTPAVIAALCRMKDALLPFLPDGNPPIIRGRKLTPELWRQWQEWVGRELERLNAGADEPAEIFDPETGEPLTDPFAEDSNASGRA